ncbi:MAG: O-antigen ligase family protein [Ignavibacteriales bacterium]|nr:O-antigen ligase family protein [Ignavibacteriales bacterium]
MNTETYTYQYEASEPWLLSQEMNRGNAIAFLLMLLVSVAASLILVLTYGNIFAAGAFVGMTVVVALTLYRVQWGFYLFVGFVLLFDQFDIPEFYPFTLKVSYFRNIKEIPYLPSLDAAVFNPLELHLLFILLVWFIVTGFKKRVHFNRIPLWGSALAFFLGLFFFVGYGLQRGGEFLVALWEVRALFYFAALYFLVPQIIQTKDDLRSLMWVCIIAIALKAFQGIARFVVLGFTLGGIPTLTNHEDPLFMLTLIVFLFAMVLYNAQESQRFTLLLLLFPLMMGFFVAQRRAAYAAMAMSFVTLFVALSAKERLLLAKTGMIFIVIVGVYSAALWESESRFASPVRLIKTAVSDDKEAQGDRYYSNLYREFEKYNLASTVKFSPVIGVGFGNKYFQPIPLANIPFPLRDYIPHNEILWLIVKTGAVGFFLFWFFLNCFACNASSVLTRLTDPYVKSVCVVAIAAVVGQITVSYYDLQLTYYRNMVYLGTLTGVVHSLEHIDLQVRAAAKNS